MNKTILLLVLVATISQLIVKESTAVGISSQIVEGIKQNEDEARLNDELLSLNTRLNQCGINIFKTLEARTLWPRLTELLENGSDVSKKHVLSIFCTMTSFDGKNYYGEYRREAIPSLLEQSKSSDRQSQQLAIRILMKYALCFHFERLHGTERQTEIDFYTQLEKYVSRETDYHMLGRVSDFFLAMLNPTNTLDAKTLELLLPVLHKLLEKKNDRLIYPTNTAIEAVFERLAQSDADDNDSILEEIYRPKGLAQELVEEADPSFDLRPLKALVKLSKPQHLRCLADWGVLINFKKTMHDLSFEIKDAVFLFDLIMRNADCAYGQALVDSDLAATLQEILASGFRTHEIDRQVVEIVAAIDRCKDIKQIKSSARQPLIKELQRMKDRTYDEELDAQIDRLVQVLLTEPEEQPQEKKLSFFRNAIQKLSCT